MSAHKKNALYIGCGDPRLWETHTKERAAIIAERDVKLYNLLVPGPDEGANGNEDHFTAELFFAEYFHRLTDFEELHFMVHTDCAGCSVSDEEHEKLAWEQAVMLAEAAKYTGQIFVGISYKPESDEYGVWVTKQIERPVADVA